MRKLVIEITENEKGVISFSMPVEEFRRTETIAFVNMFLFQLNMQLLPKKCNLLAK